MILYYLNCCIVTNRLSKFKSSKRLLPVICVLGSSFVDLCSQLGKFGDIFMANVNESDPDHTQKITTAYDSIVKGCGGEPLETAVRCASCKSSIDTTYERRDSCIIETEIS